MTRANDKQGSLEESLLHNTQTEASNSTSTQDAVHAQEQEHLSEVYAKLLEIHEATLTDIEINQQIARQDLIDMSEEVRPDFGGADEAMETLAAIETLNSVIDAYNQRHDFALARLKRTILLLLQPYFAKVTLIMRPREEPRDIYIGAAGMTDENHVPLIVDWRSPIAETYYNQATGATSFNVDGRVREVELIGRRQFDIVRDKLNMYFDTTVAIEDSLLLQALRANHSEKLRAITATIQREQNAVVRHEDVPALLVSGIAGSGKTSVMLQRIAYLFYYQRDNLRPEQVVLFTPNEVFAHYIDMVLPSLGETNPETFTWKQFVASCGLGARQDGIHTDPTRLQTFDEALSTLSLSRDDFKDISIDGVTLIKANQIATSYNKYPRIANGPRRMAATIEDLHDKLERKLERLAHDEDMQEEMFELDLDEQIRIVGEPLGSPTEQETLAFARMYVRQRFEAAHKLIEKGSWLRVDRIGMRILGADTLNACEWLYLYAVLTGNSAQNIRYVMIDEVQDYTEAQLMVFKKHFSQAHFLLLGDENQAIYENRASFADIEQIFGEGGAELSRVDLLTSYRSSPEITALFCKLMGAQDAARVAAVQESGVPVEKHECHSTEAYLDCLRELCETAAHNEGLTCMLVDTKDRLHWLSKQLGEAAPVLAKDEHLPKEGVVLLDLNLAKGLEFDHVIVADAQQEVYPTSELARKRLYTAISRATHRLTLVSQGTMSELLS